MGKLSTVVGRRRKIKDVDFLFAVRRAREIRPDDSGASRWDVASILGGMEEQVTANARDPLAPYTRQIDGIDPKQVLATARRLIKRGELAGCDCGCPGWFTVVDDVLPQPQRRRRPGPRHAKPELADAAATRSNAASDSDRELAAGA